MLFASSQQCTCAAEVRRPPRGSSACNPPSSFKLFPLAPSSWSYSPFTPLPRQNKTHRTHMRQGACSALCAVGGTPNPYRDLASKGFCQAADRVSHKPQGCASQAMLGPDLMLMCCLLLLFLILLKSSCTANGKLKSEQKSGLQGLLPRSSEGLSQATGVCLTSHTGARF